MYHILWKHSHSNETIISTKFKTSCFLISLLLYNPSLLEAGYNLDEIANATMEAIHVKRQRMDSLHASGWTGGGGGGSPIDFLTGAFETTGSALKAMDVLGVGGAVVGVGADVTDQTKKLVIKSSKVIFDGVTAAMGIASSSNNNNRSPPTLKKKTPDTPDTCMLK